MLQVGGSATGKAEIDAAARAIADGWMGCGQQVAAFETAFADHLGGPFVMTSSCSSALLLAFQVLGLPPGGEVVLPSFAWVSCAHAVVLNGLRPVFCDVDADTHNVTAETVRAAMSDATCAVLAVHYAGRPAPVVDIAALGVPVVEDAAHAVDSLAGRRPCGTLGTIGAFSFDSVKNIATPDGGGLTAGDPALVERARALRLSGMPSQPYDRRGNGGRWWEQEILAVAPRAAPNDVSAAIALAQLGRLDELQAVRREVWQAYDAELADLAWLRLPQDAEPADRHSYFTYLVRITDGRRDAVARRLLAQGIYTTLRYPPLHRQPVFASNVSLPNAERLADEGLNLPLHPGMTAADAARVIAALRSA